ncbi:MAG TPA: AmmeMemoRadiSam system protein B [Burkholderiales bacterium]|nr:AmmeMemoRadiSam system protein B [Burkholderiales bacterium]
MMLNPATPVVRPAAVAGLFYPARADELRAQVAGLFQAAEPADNPAVPKAIIVPHAGFMYSGAVAASVYARLRAARGRIRRVVLAAPAHRAHVHGMALPEATAFMTPLGEVPLDLEAMTHLRSRLPLNDLRGAHAEEHAIEVHLPFLLEALGEFKLVPILVGEASLAQAVEVLDELWGGDETLIVLSTDLSHYHPYRDAMAIDNATIDGILKFRTDITHEQACGATPLAGLLALAKRRGMRIELTDRCNSGDAAGGDRKRVVGYASFALYENDGSHVVAPEWFPDGGGRVLLRLARTSIKGALGNDPSFAMHAGWLKEQAAVFVTLKKNGELRGCIGSLEAHQTLVEDVRANAVNAALHDPRFPPVTLDELEEIEIEISLLTAPRPLHFSDQADALAQLKPGIDGVTFESAGKRATFLPQVWEDLPDPHEFIAQLKQKAGFARDYWAADVKLQRYGAVKMKD